MYLLDTNACIALIKGQPAPVRSCFQKVIAAEREVLVSSVVAFELWYGSAKSSRRSANEELIEKFFAGPVRSLAFEFEDARIAGETRATLEAAGKPIGAYDLLIAAQALRHQLTLVTANVREFSRIHGLRWEDWART
jgi:tRNA(fMet)-specific endonuclease VapC